MKVGLLGIGAIGSVIAHCIDPVHDIYYYNRSDKTKIEIIKGGTLYSKDIVLSDAAENVPLDWLLICLKEYHYKEAHGILQSLITQQTKVAVIRNGINIKESILKYTSADNIIECIIDCPTQLQSDGVYHNLYDPIIKLESGIITPSFRRLFIPRLLKIIEVEDYHTESWKKLIESSALGSILCLTGQTCCIFRDLEVVNFYGRIVDESIVAAIADGAQIGPEFKSQLLEKIKKYPDDKGSSMLTDRKKGQPIELYAKNGIISKIAKSHNINTELNDTISLLLSYINIEPQTD